MKKLFALLLVLVLLVCAFSGCTSNAEVIPTESKKIREEKASMASVFLKELYDSSGIVVKGTVLSSKTEDFYTDFGTAEEFISESVHTEFTVQVEQVYKGEKVGKKVKFWEEGGEGTELIIKNSACDAYFVGYEGFFLIQPNGRSAPGLEIKDGSVTIPGYISAPVDYNEKYGRKNQFTEEEFEALLNEYKAMGEQSGEKKEEFVKGKLVFERSPYIKQTDLQELYGKAETVVKGKITSSRSYDRYSDYGNGIKVKDVNTEITIKVEQVYKGEAVGRKIKVWEDGGEGSEIILKDPVCESYTVGYEGFFFIEPSGKVISPYLEIEDGSVTFPSYITPPKEIASKDSATVVTVEQFGEILAGYAK